MNLLIIIVFGLAELLEFRIFLQHGLFDEIIIDLHQSLDLPQLLL